RCAAHVLLDARSSGCVHRRRSPAAGKGAGSRVGAADWGKCAGLVRQLRRRQKKHDAGQGREPWSDAPVRAQKAKALRTRVHVNRAPKISPNSWVIRRSLISSLPLLTLVARALLTVQSPPAAAEER